MYGADRNLAKRAGGDGGFTPALAAGRRPPRPGEDGFTLVEVLVVVVIIGALVAIAVPVYLNYRRGAADKAAQSDIRGAIATVEQYFADNENTYPASALMQLTSFNLVTPGGTSTNLRITVSGKTIMTLYVASATATSYKLCTANIDGTKEYLYDSWLGGSIQAVTITDGNTCAT
jgi:type IV pilus assembly protein PilA